MQALKSKHKHKIIEWFWLVTAAGGDISICVCKKGNEIQLFIILVKEWDVFSLSSLGFPIFPTLFLACNLMYNLTINAYVSFYIKHTISALFLLNFQHPPTIHEQNKNRTAWKKFYRHVNITGACSQENCENGQLTNFI